MKKMFSFVIVFNLVITSAWGDQKTPEGEKTSVAQTQATKCEKVFSDRLAPADAANPMAGKIPAKPEACDYYYFAATVAQEEIHATDQITSTDKSVACAQKYGYTVDFAACKSTVKLYNMVVIAEKAMQLQQGTRQTISNNKTANEVQKKTAEGDGQNAALEATKKTTESLAGMNIEQSGLYTSAVGALGFGLKNWPDPKPHGYVTVCKGGANAFAKIKAKPGLHKELAANPAAVCTKAIEQAKGFSKTAVFANDGAKAIIAAKMIEFVQKGIAAGINADRLYKAAKAISSTQKTYDDPDMLLEKCAIDPSAAECKDFTPGSRLTGSGFQGGNFNLGSGSGNNDFTFGDGAKDEFGEEGNPTKFGNDSIGDVKSPFEDDAKVAKGILDPANAATITPGGSNPGSGGGGGGGGGGGSASLGDDIKAAEAGGAKEAEIKSSKYSGGYASNGGGGFDSVKGDKEDANPLAGLFDKSGEGDGIEEDRDIASEDIGGQDSGLFQKISNKYSQIQNEKRIEANNLE